MNGFLDFLHSPITQRALLSALLIGFANGYMSGFVVLRRSALKVGTLSHGLLPGIALAVLLLGLSSWSTLFGALFAAMFVGLGSLFLARTSRVDQDTALAILYTGAFACGYLILMRMHLAQKLDEWLFGSIFGISDTDLWISFGISAVSVLTLTALQRPLILYLFQPETASSLGVPVRALNYIMFALLILVLVSSLQAVGCILSVGLLVTPGAIMLLLSDNARTIFLGGGVIGGVAAASALLLSYPLDWHASATIIILLTVLFLLAYLFSPRYGLLLGQRRTPRHGR